jgi:PAS domain S-box-containing protein
MRPHPGTIADKSEGGTEMLTAASSRVMTMIATRRPLPEVLSAIVREVEAAHPDVLGSILLLSERRLRTGAAPSLPDDYCAAVDGVEIGPAVGSCGSAAYLGKRVIVSDIATDPRWEDFRDAALSAGLRSCWSEPFRDADGGVLGTFAMYRTRPGSPHRREMATIGQAAHLASVALQRSRSEEALTASEADAQRARTEAEAHTHRLKVALKAAGAAVVEVDYEGHAVWTSPEFAAICGCELPYSQARKAVWPFVHPDDAPPIEAAVAQWLRGTTPEPLEVRALLPDGQERWVSICTEIVKGPDARWRKTISLILDIDQRKRQELALVEAEKAALAAAETKSLFLANMSHEIRTPLNGVLVMAQLMGRGQLDARQREKLEVILQSGRSLLELINDILDFSKIDAGKLDIERVEFDPESVIRGAVASFAEVADQKGLRLDVAIAPDAQGLRIGDPTRLRQIVGNFISNALKFTARGGVTVSATGEGEAGRAGLTLSVRDTGVGIPPEKMPLLFQRFSQLDPSTTRQFGGTGLGLAICGELAQRMGGRTWAESEPGVGSTFSATLALPWCGEVRSPDGQDAGAPETHFTDEDQRQLRVLAAEDNPTNQLVLRTILDVFGLDLTVASNGLEAVEAWRGGGFDLILMDVQMPVMDGRAATRAIRAEEAAKGLPRTPIVALSANAFQHQIDEYLAAGMDAHVAKPIELPNLQRTLQQVLFGDAEDDAPARAVSASRSALTPG